MTGDTGTLKVDVFEYDGPLDLLNQLVERNRVPLDRVSIASIADQYLAIIRSGPEFDMELASSFLLMASTLIHLKSTLLLPERRQATEEGDEDPGDLLILRLMQYRRCRLLASSLKQRQVACGAAFLRAPSTPERAGVTRERGAVLLERHSFDRAIKAIASRNEARFHDNTRDVGQILERDRVSLAERMLFIARHIAGRSRVFFYELFPPELPALERITGFLAMLELVFQNKAKVTQKSLFAPILIERKGR